MLPQKTMARIGAVVLTLVTLFTMGCEITTGGPTKFPQNPGDTPDQPLTKTLAGGNIGDMSWWAATSAEVNAAGKYVTLDLSACTATGGTISGSNDLNANTMNNIIAANPYITGIILPNSLTSIGDYAFYYCASLASITIPASVASIGNGAFAGCTSLAGITVNINNTSYSSTAGVLFSKDGKKLIQYPAGKGGASYTIPGGVISIELGAFYRCASLASVTISNGVKSIGDLAFSRCTSLASVTIPASVENIGVEAFHSCSSLDNVAIPNNVTSIGESTFAYCTSLTSITIPNSVTSIGRSTFYECTNLTSITIPGNVISIGEYAFTKCTSLTSVTFGAGSDIPEADFGNSTFPQGANSVGNKLRDTYLAATPKDGTYTRSPNGDTWTKSP